jgi:hypothetical protein
VEVRVESKLVLRTAAMARIIASDLYPAVRELAADNGRCSWPILVLVGVPK